MMDANERIKGVHSASSGSILQLALFEQEAPRDPAVERVILCTYADIKFEHENEALEEVINALAR